MQHRKNVIIRFDMMKDRVDQALKLSREIMKLEQQERSIRARRDEKRTELAKLLAGESISAPPKPEYRPGSLTGRIMQLLSTRFPESLTTEAIATALGTDAPSVRSTLSRLRSAHHIESPSRGEYRAIEHEGGEEDVEGRREQSP